MSSGVNDLIIEMKNKQLEEYLKNESECDYCRYKFNKQYLNKCPICSTEVKKR